MEFSKADQNREALRLEQAAVKIQKTVKGFLSRLKYERMLIEFILAQEEARDV